MLEISVPKSQRLSYRLMNQNDGDFLFELDQDPLVMKYINGGKMTSREEITNVFLPRLKSYTQPQKGWGLWMVTELNAETYLGWVLVRPMDYFSENPQFDNIELGWRFKQLAWGKGFATEAAAAIKNALIEQTSVKTFSALAMPDNEASIKIMKKLGMTFDKKAIHKDPLGDDEAVYYSEQVIAN